jgi:hypothetical protein
VIAPGTENWNQKQGLKAVYTNSPIFLVWIIPTFYFTKACSQRLRWHFFSQQQIDFKKIPELAKINSSGNRNARLKSSKRKKFPPAKKN